MGASMAVAPNSNGLFGAALAALMLAIAAVDARKYIIPNELVAAAFALGLLRAALGAQALQDVMVALLRAAILAGAFLMVMLAYQALRRRRGMGLGDVKLAAVAGAWLDWLTIAAAIEVAALAAIAAYALRSFLRNRPLRASAALPFGLFFAPAIWLGWVVESLLF
jgi:leader peptidase (prepilin peptidase) / N-methyltransferase